MISVKDGLAAKFDNKEYRDAFVAEQIFSRLPLKIRGIREQQELTQRQLGELAGMAQTWISKLEDPNYGKLTISTLLKVAAAFDVALQIDFVPFSRVLNDALQLTAESFAVPKFQDDLGFSNSQELVTVTGNVTHSQGATMGTLLAFPSAPVSAISGNVLTPPSSASRSIQQPIAV
jgi:transcriptional regulator with XRE-family HTH domain